MALKKLNRELFEDHYFRPFFNFILFCNSIQRPSIFIPQLFIECGNRGIYIRNNPDKSDNGNETKYCPPNKTQL